MPHGSWLLQTCSPSAALASLAVVTTSLLILGYASSSFLLGAPAYEYDDGTDVVVEAAAAAVPKRGPRYPPVLAYYISGGHGDSVRMTRLLKAVYHPRNRYLLHLDAGAGAYERTRLAGYARSERAFLEYGNQSTNAEISFSSGQRAKPDAFELFKGAPWPILSRDFIEYCVLAPDNLPRTLLLYFSNSLSPMEFYFQTVIANSGRFRNSTVNHSLRHTVARDGGGYTAVAQDAGQQPPLRYDAIVGSGAAFAGTFSDDDEALLQRVDEEVLGRPLDGVTPGEWCEGDGEEAAGEECSVGGDIDVVRHGAMGRRLATLMADIVGGRTV
uniref:Glycosyltransferase family 14 protein n=1 Tax=Oryza brachyantha TaxID=4533 RepID=J3L4J3_ORYBR